jgi:DNA topoisomerase-1
MEKKQIVPEDKGRLVTAFLERFFSRYVEYDFTASLEEKLDLISDHKLAWKEVLREFWREFMEAVEGTKELKVSDVLDALNDLLGPHIFPDKGDGTNPRTCPKCGLGQLSLKISGKNGAFVGCSNYGNETTPCRYTRQLSQSGDGPDSGLVDGKVLGVDPTSGEEVTIRTGRFGTYLQLGEAKSKDEKPKRSSLPKGWDPATIDIERALMLLNLPREVGPHPEDGEMINAGLGRYGPYVQHGKRYANVESIEDVFTIGINRAVTVLAEKAAGKGGRFGRGQAQREVLKDLGEHPEFGGKMEILNGRYGPYISHNKVFANVPRGKEPAEVTSAEAVLLLAERAAKGPSKGKPKKTSGGKPKAAADKTDAAPAPRKAAAKSAPKKKAGTRSAPKKDAAE